MAKHMNLLTALILLIITTTSSTSDSTFSNHASRKTLGLTREKQTHLHFYFHDIITAPPTRTAYPLNLDAVAKINSSTLFGMLVMADEPLTLEPSINSTLVGRAQGMYGSASLMDAAFFMVFNFAFSHGEYNGSTISLYGRNEIFDDVREMPIVGGTGAFRFARGYALAKTYSVDVVTFNAVVEYDVYVTHYY